MRAVKSSPGPEWGGIYQDVFPPGLELNGFFVAHTPATTGGITHPSMRLKRPIRINVASLACVSWVSIPRGRENWSHQEGCTGMMVSLDKRELLSLVDKQVDKLPTGHASGACPMRNQKMKGSYR